VSVFVKSEQIVELERGATDSCFPLSVGLGRGATLAKRHVDGNGGGVFVAGCQIVEKKEQNRVPEAMRSRK